MFSDTTHPAAGHSTPQSVTALPAIPVRDGSCDTIHGFSDIRLRDLEESLPNKQKVCLPMLRLLRFVDAAACTVVSVPVLQVIRSLLSNTKYVIVVEHDLSVLDYLSDWICCLYGKPGAYGVVTMPFGCGLTAWQDRITHFFLQEASKQSTAIYFMSFRRCFTFVCCNLQFAALAAHVDLTISHEHKQSRN